MSITSTSSAKKHGLLVLAAAQTDGQMTEVAQMQTDKQQVDQQPVRVLPEDESSTVTLAKTSKPLNKISSSSNCYISHTPTQEDPAHMHTVILSYSIQGRKVNTLNCPQQQLRFGLEGRQCRNVGYVYSHYFAEIPLAPGEFWVDNIIIAHGCRKGFRFFCSKLICCSGQIKITTQFLPLSTHFLKYADVVSATQPGHIL